jgi:hypothetical protein
VTTSLFSPGKDVTACDFKVGLTAPLMCCKMRTSVLSEIAAFRPDAVTCLPILINWYV